MKSIEQWLKEYGHSHTHPINKAIHWCAVPIIYLTVFGLLWALPRPALFDGIWLNWATLAAVVAMIFYFRLSLVVGVAMSLFTLLVMALIYWFDTQQWGSLPVVCALLFAVMWVFQFVGHHIEGKKPSFFKDIQFLLIGPLWLMAFILRKLGIRY